MSTTTLGRYGSAQKVTGQIWQNGEFGFCVQRTFALRVPLHEVRGEAKERSFYRPVMPDLRESVHGSTKGRYERIDVRLEKRPRAPIEVDENSIKELALTDVAISHNRAKRGSKGISKYGQRLVRNAGHQLQSQFKKERLAFLTLTVPPLESQQFELLLDGWADVVRVFVQWLRRRLKKACLPSHVVGCSEVQEERFGNTLVPYPHLHLVYVGRHSRGNWCLHFLDIRKAWMRALNAVLTESLELKDCYRVERVEQVAKNVGDYLGKYMSKGSELMKAVCLVLGRDRYLTAYYTISEKLKEIVLKKRIVGNGEVFNFLSELCDDDLDGIFIWRRKIYIGEGKERIPWGYAGKLTEWGITVLRDFLTVK